MGVMGGHAVSRDTEPYAGAARLGHRLAAAGLAVLTGGGPGAMEAANLGALAPDATALDDALARLAAVPSFVPDIAPWAEVALGVHDDLLRMPVADPRVRSIGIPTWFYGHEPPNVFCNGIAKYFSNALREDGLLARCTSGLVVLEGAAGTVQEVFQVATRLYYADPESVLPGRRPRRRAPLDPHPAGVARAARAGPRPAHGGAGAPRRDRGRRRRAGHLVTVTTARAADVGAGG